MNANPPGLDDARAILRSTFGYPDFRGGQADAVAGALSGHDTLVLMPTGGGKSLCYQIPALTLGGLTLVVSPLISLMKDQVDALARRGVAAAALHSGMTPEEIEHTLREAVAGRLVMLYVAPERFDAPAFRDALPDMPVRLLAIDEAHCISQWGYDFRPAYLRLGDVREILRCPVLALTATATPDVRDDIIRRLRLADPILVTRGFDRTNLAWHALAVRDEPHRMRLLRDLLRARDGGVAVVYAATRRAVDNVTDALNRTGLRAAAYHAGIPPDERARLQDAFIDSRLPVIVATNAFGMGIDKPDVRIVVHVTMASNLEGYYQEAGRAGRDGQPAHCVLLHAWKDRLTHEFFIDQAHPPRRAIEALFAALASLARPGETTRLSPAALARATGGACSTRQADAALRALHEGDVIRIIGPEPVQPTIRFVVPHERAARALLALGRTEQADTLRHVARFEGRALRHIDRSTMIRLQTLHDDGWIELRRTSGNLRIQRISAAPPARLPLDWNRIDRLRRRETLRLASMQGYAFTRHCRRAFVLRYFGDPDAADRCSGCDNCLGPTHRILPHAPPPRGPTPDQIARQLLRTLKARLT